jgi:hypothetical protein
MAVVLPRGTKEYLLVDVEDLLGNVTTLTGHNPRYSVKDEVDAFKYTDQAGSSTGMVAYCMVDTNAGGLWAAGIYRLYLRFDATPEIPYLGPFEFEVSGA